MGSGIRTFRQFTEAFDAVANYRWFDPDNPDRTLSSPDEARGDVSAEFIVYSRAGDSMEYVVEFSFVSPEDTESKSALTKLSFFEYIEDAWSVVFSTSTGDTGTIGNTQVQQQVFATVLAVIKDFVSVIQPHVIEFAAKEPNRQRLYQRLIQTQLKYSRPYKMIDPIPMTDGTGVVMGMYRKP